MSKQGRRSKRSKRRPRDPGGGQITTAELGDGAIWFSVFFIAGFAMGFGFLLGGRSAGLIAAAAWALVVLFHLVMSVFAVYRGRSIPGWKRSLASLPLRFVGFGRSGGRPVEAARGDARARTAAVACTLVSLAMATGLVLFIGRSIA